VSATTSLFAGDPMHPSHLLLLLLAVEPPRSLSPAAGEHNTRAMEHYDAGRFGPAVDEFYAAYRAMPDGRRDREGRLLLLGSMRSTLLQLHRQTGGPAPLCRLRAVLQEHLDGLMAAFPDAPDMQETRSVRARHDAVTQQLAAIDPAACEPPPPPPVAAAPVAAAPAVQSPAPPSPAPGPVTSDGVGPEPAARQRWIAGGVMLPLGAVALGVLGGVASTYRRTLDEADGLHEALLRRPCTDDDRARMRDLLTASRRQEAAMIGLGVVGGALVTAGAALLVRGGLQRRRARLGLDLRRDRVGFTLSGEF
jgi:hypothetical protein